MPLEKRGGGCHRLLQSAGDDVLQRMTRPVGVSRVGDDEQFAVIAHDLGDAPGLLDGYDTKLGTIHINQTDGTLADLSVDSGLIVSTWGMPVSANRDAPF